MHVRSCLDNLYPDFGNFCTNIYASHANLTLGLDDMSGVLSMLNRPISPGTSRLSTLLRGQRFAREARVR